MLDKKTIKLKYFFNTQLFNFLILIGLLLILPGISIYLGLFNLVLEFFLQMIIEFFIIISLCLLFYLFLSVRNKRNKNISIKLFYLGIVLIFLFSNILSMFFVLAFFLKFPVFINSFYFFFVITFILCSGLLLFVDFDAFTILIEFVTNLHNFLLNSLLVLIVLGLLGFVLTITSGNLIFILSLFLSIIFTLIIKILLVKIFTI